MTTHLLGKLLREASAYLQEQQVDSPQLSAELLLAQAGRLRRLDVLVRPEIELDAEMAASFRELIRRRGQGEPVAYLLERKEFYGREFEVGPDVLIPRPETELVVEKCKQLFPSDAQLRMADICAGSGNLAVTLCAEFPGAQCLMADISHQALQIACRNASRHGVADRTQPVKQDFASALKPECVDLAVCNPPYISAEDYPALDREVVEFEPRIALDGGKGGLETVRTAVRTIAVCLAPGGYLLMETGRDQAGFTAEEMKFPGTGWQSVRIHTDLGGNDRLISAQRVWL